MPSNDLTNTALACRAQQGESDAFEQLVGAYTAPLRRFAWRWLRDDDAANDVCQQVFLQLYLLLPTLRVDQPLKSWLFQVARNRCIDELRRKGATRFSELEQRNWRHDDEEEDSTPLYLLPDGAPQPDEVVAQRDLHWRLQQAINALPPKFRAVVALRAADLSYTEIGARLKMPPATAKTYFQRAKPLLRILLARYGVSSAA